MVEPIIRYGYGLASFSVYGSTWLAAMLLDALRFRIADFPGGPVVLTTCQFADHGFDPWSGKILHAMGTEAHMPQLPSPCAANTEAHTPRACAPQQEKPP